MSGNYGVSYGRYAQLYDGLEEERFNGLLPLALERLDTLTHGRVKELAPEDWRLRQAQNAVYGMIRYMQRQGDSAPGMGIVSVSNDGYSESYQATTPDAAENCLRAICLGWLSGTGLMGAL